MNLRRSTVLLATLSLISACGSSDRSSESEVPLQTNVPVLSQKERAGLHAAAIKSLELFVAAPTALIEGEFGKCRSAVVGELRPHHLNVMVSDGNLESAADLKKQAEETLKTYRASADAVNEVFNASFELCTFNSGASGRQVNTVSASCNFVNGRYRDHYVGTPMRVPDGLVYTCDGLGF